MIASTLFYAIIIVMVIAYTSLIVISDSFGLGLPILAIGAIAITIIIPITYVRFVIQFIKSFVWEYDDLQDLKFLWDCVDHICLCVIKEWLKNDITDRQNQLETLQYAKHKTKEDISFDKTLKKRNDEDDSIFEKYQA